MERTTFAGGGGLVKRGVHARPGVGGHLTRALKSWGANGFHFMCQSDQPVVGALHTRLKEDWTWR